MRPAQLLAHRPDRGKNADIAVVPIATDLTVSRQFVVTEPFPAKVSDSHAADKMEKGVVRTDRNSPRVQVAQLREQVGRQICCHVLLNVFADGLRDPEPQLL